MSEFLISQNEFDKFQALVQKSHIPKDIEMASHSFFFDTSDAKHKYVRQFINIGDERIVVWRRVSCQVSDKQTAET